MTPRTDKPSVATLEPSERHHEIARWTVSNATATETVVAIYECPGRARGVTLRRSRGGEFTPFHWRLRAYEIDNLIAALTDAKQQIEAALTERPTPATPMRAPVNRSMRPERTRGRGAL